jgi:hypothetical protein
MNDYYVAFWNVENLFDIEGSPRRSDKLERTLRNELGGWTEEVLEKKIAQLASVIMKMNGSQGPDLLGVAEVENEYVLRLLCSALAPTNRRYDVAHFESSDGRGIDVAFIYDTEKFIAREKFAHYIVKRVATRELFQVNFVLKGSDSEKLLVVIGNHWPSRLGGVYESEPYRMVAGETLAYFHQRIREIHGDDVAVLVMGDFNDEPFDRSLVDHALSERVALKVALARTPRLWNLMWPLTGQGVGSHYYQNHGAMLDQFLVSHGLINGASGISAQAGTVELIQFPEMISAGAYGVPRRFGRGASRDEQGFSDHFPIGLTLQG